MEISDFLSKMSIIQRAYNKMCNEILVKYNIQKTSFDIIMFLANNKKYYTANAISEIKNIKPNVVSIHVEKLVSDGLIERQAVKGDRRKVKLVCTDLAKPIIKKGRIIQEKFFSSLIDGLSEQERENFKNYFKKIADNASLMI